MSKTVIECTDGRLLAGFRAGFEFGAGDGVAIMQGVAGCNHWLLIEADDDFDNQTYTLDHEANLCHKHTGVEL